MKSSTIILALRKSAALALTLAIGSLGILLSAKAPEFWTVVGTVFAPLGVIGEKLVLIYLQQGKLTDAQVNAVIDGADPNALPTAK